MPRCFPSLVGAAFLLCSVHWTQAESTSARSAAVEPLGPCSRRGPIIISEIMYHPAPRTDGKRLEFVELYNSQPWDEDISGHRLAGDIEYTFPNGTIFPALSFIVVAKSPADLAPLSGVTNVFGPYQKDFGNGSGSLELRNEFGALLLSIAFKSKAPWPASTDGIGHSLVLARPSYGEDNPEAWAQSDQVGGSPGRPEANPFEPLRAVTINEFVVLGTAEHAGFIELHNGSRTVVDLSGCFLRTDSDANGFQIPQGTSLVAGGSYAFPQAVHGLKLDPKEGVLFLWAPDQSRVLDAVNYEGQSPGLAQGRVPDGGRELYPLRSPTPGGSNSSPLVSEVVINEVMYDPISGSADDQYVELFNQSAQPVDVSSWQFVHGITFTLPKNRVLAAGGYLVIARNAQHLMGMYPQLNVANTLGDFAGSLSHKGERLALARTESIIETNQLGVVHTTQVPVIVEEVTYGTGGRWGHWAHGGGSSLELVDPRSNHRLASNWADSDETQKSAWVTVENTGRMEQGSGSADSLQVLMLNDGECLVDNVAVRTPGGTNVVLNGDFSQGLTNWVAQGTHVRSTLESNTGVGGSQCLHVRASAEGDPGANRIRVRLSPIPVNGRTETLHAEVRWLHGFPEILLRLKGNYLEATTNILTTLALGSPGLPNSQAVPNAGPAIVDVVHRPILPVPNQRVVVTAHVDDPDGLSAVQLNYRIDPATAYTSVPMVDDGTGDDAIAGDGVFSAALPGKAAGALIAFFIEATDAAPSGPQISRFPNDAPGRECLVRFGDPKPASHFGSYRLWLTKQTVDTWTKREILSREPLDGTFVYGDYRVIYNAGGRYSGSPYHQSYGSPVAGNCQYSVDIPDDDLLLGTTSFNKIHAPGNSPFDDPSIQVEQTAYWVGRKIGLPYNYKRYIQMYVNGSRSGSLMEDTLVPGSSMIEEFFPDDPNGDLHKLYGWFEFDNAITHSLGFQNVAWATLENFTHAGGAKNLARYRWNWRPRAVQGSANNFTNLFALVDAANNSNPTSYPTNLLAHADIEEWMRTFALQHAVGNWDSYGNDNGQNTYAYKPERGPWALLIWDFNIVLGNGSDGPTGDDLFKAADPMVVKMYNIPLFRRAYWRALKEIVNGPMLTNQVNPLVDARYAAFKASGANVSAPTSLKGWIARRRTYLLSKLNTVAANFAVTDYGGNDFSTNRNPVTVRGSAPVEVTTIKINDVAYPITWTSVTNWSIRIAFTSAANTLHIEGFDASNRLVTNASTTVNINLSGNSLVPSSPLFINEWLAANQRTLTNAFNGQTSGWLELYNPSSHSVDLTGYTLTDISTTQAPFGFPAGTQIGPLGFLLVWCDGAPSAVVPGDPSLHTSFLLDPTGGAILLFAPDGSLVDSVGYSEQQTDISEGRFPDGAPPPFYLMDTPTPQKPNALPVGSQVQSPQILDATLTSDGFLGLRWTAQVGNTYHIQFKTNLAERVWHNLSGDVLATESIASKADTSGIHPARFYRIEVAP